MPVQQPGSGSGLLWIAFALDQTSISLLSGAASLRGPPSRNLKGTHPISWESATTRSHLFNRSTAIFRKAIGDPSGVLAPAECLLQFLSVAKSASASVSFEGFSSVRGPWFQPRRMIN